MESTKTRHGCLTAWLTLVIVSSALSAVTAPLFMAEYRRANPGLPAWLIWATALLSALNVVFAVALFRWKKWGFIGFCVTGVLAAALSLYAGLGIARAVLMLIGVVILYGLLQVGGDKKAWPQLE